MCKIQDELFKDIRKLTSVFYRKMITVNEFVNSTIDNLTRYDIALPRVTELWVLIPDKCREEFEVDIRKIVQPDYLHGGFRYGGGRPPTAEEILQERIIYTDRVRIWAVKLIELFDVEYTTP